MARRSRGYHSPVRAARADATRRRILTAARTLFATRGYAGTTLDAVAREGGVAIQTVYQVFGSKVQLLEAQLDALDEIGGLDRLRAVLDDASAAPEAMARALARFVGRLYAAAGDVLEAARTAGRGDAGLQRLLDGGLARHNAGVGRMTRDWARRGALRRGLTARDAAAIVASLSGPDMHHRLVREWKWSHKRYEAWLADAIVQLTLRQPPPRE